MPNTAVSTEKPSRRRWFQFSLRTLLIVTTLIGCGCGWLAMKIQQANRQHAAVEQLRQRGRSTCHYDYEIDDDGRFIADATPRGPAWLRAMFGDDLFANVVSAQISVDDEQAMQNLAVFPKLESFSAIVPIQFQPETAPHPSPAVLEMIGRAKELRELRLYDSAISDSDLEHLHGLSRLHKLDLTKAQISLDGLLQLPYLTQLVQLTLDETQITGDQLARLPAMPQLEWLSLSGLQQTDSLLAQLDKFPRLQTLELTDSDITGAGLQRLSQAPKLDALYLGYTRLKPADFKHLYGLKQLKLITVPVADSADTAELEAALPNCTVSTSYPHDQPLDPIAPRPPTFDSRFPPVE